MQSILLSFFVHVQKFHYVFINGHCLIVGDTAAAVEVDRRSSGQDSGS